jgi:hypothetical protein
MTSAFEKRTGDALLRKDDGQASVVVAVGTPLKICWKTFLRT